MTSEEGLGAAAVQIDRPLRGRSEVVRVCHLGLPVVIRVAPVLDDGTPFPTRYWLTCPLAVIRIGRLEAACRIRFLAERTRSDPDFALRLASAHDSYARDRDADIPQGHTGPRPSGGVGGSASPDAVKCLHAHYAHLQAGYPNPVGEDVAPDIEPLDCELPCVLGSSRNPAWKEPPHGVSGPAKRGNLVANEGCGGRHRNELHPPSGGRFR